MKLLPILNINKYSNFKLKTGEKKTFSPSFLSHPDYDFYDRTSNVRASSHFRRGRFYGTPSENYQNIENTLKKVYEQNKKPKILLVGLGRGEEAFSIVASIYTITKKPKKLSKVVEINGVELGPKLTESEIESSSVFYNYDAVQELNFAKDSFGKKRENKGIWYEGVEFKPEITDFIKKTFNSKNIQWDTSIQEFLKTNKKTYDVFVMNNVLLYMKESDQIETIKKAKEIINPKGIIITDPDDEYFKKHALFDDWTQLAKGIYQKPEPLLS